MNAHEKTKFRRSSKWKNWRKYLLNKRGKHCEICGMPHRTGLNIHHCDERHYDDLREEKFSILCKSCHQEIERLLKRTTNEVEIDDYCSNMKRVYETSKEYKDTK